MIQRWVSVLLCILLGGCVLLYTWTDTTVYANSVTTTVETSAESTVVTEIQNHALGDGLTTISYDQYLKGRNNAPEGTKISIDMTRFTASDDMQASVKIVENTNAVITGDSGIITWEFTVTQPGLYDVLVSYYAMEGKGGAIERQLYLDGSIPYKEAKNLQFNRVWVNEGQNKIFTESGNEYRRPQVEKFCWQEEMLHSSIGYRDDSMKLYLEPGNHKIALESISEPMAIANITLMVNTDALSYETVQKQYSDKGYQKTTKEITVEGEDVVRKSDSTLYAIEDRTSPINSPYDESKILLNSIGGNSWRYRQQWLEWDVDVPEDGLYNLSLRTKQDFVSGAYASRCIYIDGKIPFEEASTISVTFNLRWQMLTLGDKDNPYEFYLSKGLHTIRLEAVIGNLTETLTEISDIVQQLNTLYRRIKMIVGSFPDPLRDYELEANMPELFTLLKDYSDRLENANKAMVALNRIKGEQSRFIDQLVVQIKSLIKYPDTLPERQIDLSDNINNVSSWLASASEVPLLIDYIILTPGTYPLPPANAGFFAETWSSFKGFVYSFIYDYYAIESLSGESEIQDEISLWLGIGRDQSMIIKDMADSSFTSSKKIGLNIKLVDMSILLQAVSSGTGPDVALFMDQAQPLNYGVRGALYDLSKFKDLDEVLKRFADSAVEPFRLGGALYGLPEQQMFPMLFYRTDVFEEMGLSVPQTWEDLYKMIPTLQEQNMEIGLPSPSATTSGSQATSLNPVYAALLLQNGATVYDKDKRMCTLNTLPAVNCFIQWSEFYNKYNFPKFYSEINRFRTGEMPLLISSYTFYNTLALAAPEIQSLWSMAPIPGTRKNDGTIDRSVSSSGTACVIFENAKNPNASWELMKWWTSTETQVRYGREIEALQGSSARWPTANMQAMQELGWTTNITKQISEQWKYVIGIPEVPGGYYVGRSVDNAIKSVINSGEDAREIILDQVDKINKEIRNKRQEFGLE
jgi:ABC-type glycerol-3-phosphate transport system substrate-binding protein